MFRRMFQGGPSRKQGPRLAIRDADEEPPRDAPVRPCEWPSENFMNQVGIKEDFNAYLRKPVLRTLKLINAPSIVISQVHLWGGLIIHLRVILLQSCLTFMTNLIPWT